MGRNTSNLFYIMYIDYASVEICIFLHMYIRIMDMIVQV